MKLSLLLLLLAFLGCDEASDTRAHHLTLEQERALTSMGFSEPKPDNSGSEFWNCGRDDSALYSAGFTALNPVGRRVTGVVCCGLWKGCTVRF